jgi:sulfonate transport system permease protein
VSGTPSSGSAPTLVAAGPAGSTASSAGAGAASPAARGRLRWWPARRGLLRLISPVVLLLLWQGESQLGLVSTQKLPPPSEVWSTAISLITTNSPAYGTLQGAMLVSLERVAIGFGCGAAAGIFLAMVTGLSRIGEHAADPPMQMLRTLPLFGLIPVFIVWFGIGELPKILLITIGSAIPLYLNTFAGIRSVDGKLAEVGQVLHLRRRELITHIVLPGALPQLFVGLRLSLGAAWLSLVVAEQINANAGLGFMINQAEQFDRNDVIFVCLLVYCILGLLTDALVRLLERKALVWRRGLLDQ